MGEAFMPRRGGSFVKHSHDCVETFEWSEDEDDNGNIKSVTCSRVYECNCGYQRKEEITVEKGSANWSTYSNSDYECSRQWGFKVNVTFSDGTRKDKTYQTGSETNHVAGDIVIEAHENGTHRTYKQCIYCGAVVWNTSNVQCTYDSDGVCICGNTKK